MSESNQSGQGRNELFIRSIPLDVTHHDLENFFSDFAPVKHAVVVKDPETQESRGFGFVSFASPEDAKTVVEAASSKKINGQTMRIEFARPRTRKDAESAGEASSVEKRRPRLIVRNVPWSLRDPKELETIFSKYGRVTEAFIPRGKNNRMSGFAFVTMRRKAQAKNAIEGSKNLEIHGRSVTVDFAVEKEKWLNQKSSDPKEALEDDNDDDDESDDDDDDDEEDEEDESDSEDTPDEAPQPKRRALSDQNTIFVRNIPYDATAEDLQEHFENFGPVAYALPVMDKRLNQPKGTAFVAFKYKDSCAKCVDNAPKVSSSSLLLPDDVDTNYVYQGRVLSVTQAVSQNRAETLSQKGAEERAKALGKEPNQKDKRNLFLLNEGRITSQSKLAELLSASDLQLRDKSYQLRKTQLNKNPSLHLSLTRLAIRNLPRGMDQKALKALGRKAVVEFAKEVKDNKRHPLSKEEVMRSKHFDDILIEKDAKTGKHHGVVKQAKVVQELKGSGEAGRSRGYGFLEMKNHKFALMALRWLNAHLVTREEIGADEQTEKQLGQESRRLVVEFAIENAQVVKRQRDRHLRDKQFGLKRKEEAEAKEKAEKEAIAAAEKEKLSKGSHIVGKKRALKRKRGKN